MSVYDHSYYTIVKSSKTFYGFYFEMASNIRMAPVRSFCIYIAAIAETLKQNGFVGIFKLVLFFYFILFSSEQEFHNRHPR